MRGLCSSHLQVAKYNLQSDWVEGAAFMIDNHFLWQNQSAEINQKHGRKKTLTSCQSLFKIKLPNCLLYLAGGDGIAAAEYLFTQRNTHRKSTSQHASPFSGISAAGRNIIVSRNNPREKTIEFWSVSALCLSLHLTAAALSVVVLHIQQSPILSKLLISK